MTTGIAQNDELLLGFIDEAIHGLRSLPDQLREFRQSPQNVAPIHAVFRAVHSIKGNAGFFGLTAIKKFAHALENTLDEVRNGRLDLSEELQRALTDGFDQLDEMLHGVLDGQATEELGPRALEILQTVENAIANGDTTQSPEARWLDELTALADEIAAAKLPQSERWVKILRTLAPSEQASEDAPLTSNKRLPQAWAIENFAWEGDNVTAQTRQLLLPFIAAGEGNFDRALCQMMIADAQTLANQLAQPTAADIAGQLRCAAENMAAIVNCPLDLDATLLSIVWEALEPALTALHAPAFAIPSPTAEPVATPPAAESKEIAAPATTNNPSGGKNRLIRVKEEHLDEFVDDVSHLFITCERLKDLHARMSSEKQLASLVDELKQINAAFYTQTNNLQHSVVTLRNVPVQALFGKFPRMARSLAGNLGKQLDVRLIGEELGIDKSLVEDLDSPLTHMVRNVCDHAIETTEERQAVGKPIAGLLTLKCELTRSHVIITIEDDGRGIDPGRLRRKAREKKLLPPEQIDALTDAEAIDLIFHPGFSTAEQVTEVSGRGVGMDVVRTTLREHDGDVTVTSQLGVGTTFKLTIPIRQAVLVVDGLLLRDGNANYVVPLEQIREIVELRPSDLKTVQSAPIAVIRGEPLAAVSLAEMLNLPPMPLSGQTVYGIVLRSKEGMICMLTERVLGQRKVVINSIRELLPQVDKVAGVAQLGGGKLALVLSASDLIRQAATPRTA